MDYFKFYGKDGKEYMCANIVMLTGAMYCYIHKLKDTNLSCYIGKSALSKKWIPALIFFTVNAIFGQTS